MSGDLIDDDPDIGAAMEKILARGPAAWGDGPAREDTRENRDDREPHEMAEDADTDNRPDPEAQEDQSAEASAPEGDEQFLEIPGETDDAEPTKIPLSEAADAVKQIRQMNGDIAAAVIKAETEAQEKADRYIGGLAEAYRQIEVQARSTVQVMRQLMPQPPDESMLDDRSENYDPQGYYARRAYVDKYVAHMSRVEATIEQAMRGRDAVRTEADNADEARENTRLARYIPEWSKDETRAAKKTEIIDALKTKYGVSMDDFDGVVSHKAWRMMNDLAKLTATQAKAPEIKKSIQEKAAKITNGKMPARAANGQFVNSARTELRNERTEDAAARLFMKSGLAKSLLREG